MNPYAERLRELEEALDRYTRHWLLDGDIPMCRFCCGHTDYYWNSERGPFPHEPTCPREIMVNRWVGPQPVRS